MNIMGMKMPFMQMNVGQKCSLPFFAPDMVAVGGQHFVVTHGAVAAEDDLRFRRRPAHYIACHSITTNHVPERFPQARALSVRDTWVWDGCSRTRGSPSPPTDTGWAQRSRRRRQTPAALSNARNHSADGVGTVGYCATWTTG